MANLTNSSNLIEKIESLEPNVIAMTQAQYDALSAAEKADGKLRIITDAPQLEVWTPIVYLTQAEYDALPSSKLTDGKNYFIIEGELVLLDSCELMKEVLDQPSCDALNIRPSENRQLLVDALNEHPTEYYDKYSWELYNTWSYSNVLWANTHPWFEETYVIYYDANLQRWNHATYAS